MEQKQLERVTANIPEIRELLLKQKDAKRRLKQINRKLTTSILKFEFIRQMMNGKGTDLHAPLKRYFKFWGIGKVTILSTHQKDEDLHIIYNNNLILVEVSGTPNDKPEDKKIFQVQKRIASRKSEYPNHNVYGLYICNHYYNKPFNKRSKTPYDSTKREQIRINSITATTTRDLLNAIVLHKQGTMTLDEFVTKLCTPGVFSCRGICEESALD